MALGTEIHDFEVLVHGLIEAAFEYLAGHDRWKARHVM